jgi:UDP-glucose-4-epimerase GalE
MSVLITGAAGYIGRHTVRQLLAGGYQVVSLGHRRESVCHADHETHFVEGDVADRSLVQATLRNFKVTAVVHLAASVNVAESLGQPDQYFSNNTLGTLRLLEAMRAEGVSQIVFASTASVYGTSTEVPAREDDAPEPLSPYGESKLQAEHMLRWYEQAFGLRWIALRYSNVAGAEPGLGEDLCTSIRLVPRAVRAAVDPSHPLYVFGTTFPTKDGSAVRDFIHVSDVARANLLSLRLVSSRAVGEVINIGTSQGRSIFDLIAAVGQEVGRPVRYEQRSAIPRDPAFSISDISKAAGLLGWSPQQSDLAHIVASTARAALPQQPWLDAQEQVIAPVIPAVSAR